MRKLTKLLICTLICLMAFSSVVMAEDIKVAINSEMKKEHKKIEYSDGSFYEGEVVNGLLDGYGLMVWSNGDKYEGQWKQNKQDGTGKYTWSDSKVYDGLWENGEYVKGTFTYPSGEVKEYVRNTENEEVNNKKVDLANEELGNKYIKILKPIIEEITNNTVTIPEESKTTLRNKAQGFFGTEREELQKYAEEVSAGQLAKNSSKYQNVVINKKHRVITDHIEQGILDNNQNITVAIVHTGDYVDEFTSQVIEDVVYVDRTNYMIFYLGRNDVVKNNDVQFTGVVIGETTIDIGYQTQPLYVVVAGDFRKYNYLGELLNKESDGELSDKTKELLNKESGNTKEGNLVGACKTGDMKEVKRLLEQGVSPDADLRGATALCEAVRNNHYEIAELLLKSGADVNKEYISIGSFDGFEPIFLAVQKSNKEMIKLLVKYDAKLDVNSSYYDSPIDLALKNKDLEILQELLSQGANPNITYFDDYYPLNYAINEKNIEAIKVLLKGGADPNYQKRNAYHTPLGIAVKNGSTEIVKSLIENGADVNKTTAWGGTVLELAKYYRYDDIVKILEKNGAKE